ncbi:MAG: Scr1 family TA system antitoxin-like transcriptional regulator, partial [Micromonosporaceae bacterium]
MSKPDNPLGEWLTEPGGLAERLRAIRLRAGLTGYQLADEQGWPQSKISKIENGRQVPSVADIRRWLAACGAVEDAEGLIDQLEQVSARHQDWRRRLRQGMPIVQAGYNDLVRDLSTYRCFTADVVPGLLQTAEYARYPLSEGVMLHGAPADDLDAAVATRMQRQQHLYDTSKRFEFILAEPVLRWLICPPAAMLGQLDRLLAVVSGLPNVRFGVLPLGRRLSLCPGNT